MSSDFEKIFGLVCSLAVAESQAIYAYNKRKKIKCYSKKLFEVEEEETNIFNYRLKIEELEFILPHISGETGDYHQILLSSLRSLAYSDSISYFNEFELPLVLMCRRKVGKTQKKELIEILFTDFKKYMSNTEQGITELSFDEDLLIFRIIPCYLLNPDVNQAVRMVCQTIFSTNSENMKVLLVSIIITRVLDYLSKKVDILTFGEVFEFLTKSESEWSKFPYDNLEILSIPMQTPEKHAKLLKEWNTCIEIFRDLTNVAFKDLRKGSDVIIFDAIENIWKHKRTSKYSNYIKALVFSLFIFSLYASDPSSAILKSVNLKHKAMDDYMVFIVSLIGCFFGAREKSDWIPLNWEFFENFDYSRVLSEYLSSADDKLEKPSRDEHFIFCDDLDNVDIGDKLHLSQTMTASISNKDTYECNNTVLTKISLKSRKSQTYVMYFLKDVEKK
jgi:hypothetical protein